MPVRILFTLMLLFPAPDLWAGVLVGVMGSGVAGAGPTITRSSTGKVRYDAFSSTYSDWTEVSGGHSITANYLRLNNNGGNPGAISHSITTVSKPLFVTFDTIIDRQNMSYTFIDFKTGTDRYTVFPKYNGTAIYIQKNGSNLTNVSDTTTEGSPDSYGVLIDSNGVTVYRAGTQKLTSNDTSLNNFDALQLNGSDSTVDYGGYWRKLAVMKGATITCSGLPSGYKLRVNGSGGPTATESGGTATVSCTSLQFPTSTVEVLDGSNTVKATFTSTDDVWGGDAYSYSQ